MTDKQFLNWIADRLVFVHGDAAAADFVLKLREIGDASGPGPREIPRMGEPDLRKIAERVASSPPIFEPASFGLKCFAGVFTVLVVVLLVWGALSI